MGHGAAGDPPRAPQHDYRDAGPTNSSDRCHRAHAIPHHRAGDQKIAGEKRGLEETVAKLQAELAKLAKKK